VTVDEFRHEAFFYAGESDFLLGTLPFLRQGLERGESVLVVESAEKVALLRSELGEDGDLVMFADMADVGANPARIVPAWQEFVERHGRNGAGLRGIGEPIWASRPHDELVECQRHESLLNVAFAGGRPWRLLCPYDTSELPHDVIEEARRSHAFVIERHVELPSPHYRGPVASGAAFAGPLSAPPTGAATAAFDASSLREVRRLVAAVGAAVGMDVERLGDLVAAANEVATNSVQHGGGSGTVIVWEDSDSVLCEVRDRGRYAQPLADRRKPLSPREPSGLWLANMLCDLVQIRTYPTGTVARLVMRRERRRAAQGWSWAVS
jgi:anti-sigma regulatory factor (Ser/Thr protein kinase)